MGTGKTVRTEDLAITVCERSIDALISIAPGLISLNDAMANGDLLIEKVARRTGKILTSLQK